MAISESTALSRARATRAAFPKGKITQKQARAMFVAMADSQVGYASGNPNYSMYGKASNWRTKWNGRNVYWCALFGSWCAEQAFGREAALAGFGRQVNSANYPPVGGTWTVWVLGWGRARGAVKPFNSQQSGDISLQRYGRTGAEVDHYEIVRTGRSLNLSNTIGGNTSPGNASAGAGVYRAVRSRGVTKAIIRPDWNALVRVYNSQITEDDMSDAQYNDLKKMIKGVDTKVNKLRGERTNSHVQQMALLGKISDQLNVVGRVAAEARAAAKAVPAAVVAFRVPFSKGTSLHRLFGKDFRFGALLGYAGASLVDRDSHTAEIVDALDADALTSEVHALEDESQEAQEQALVAAESVRSILAQDAEAEALVAADVAQEQA